MVNILYVICCIVKFKYFPCFFFSLALKWKTFFISSCLILTNFLNKYRSTLSSESLTIVASLHFSFQLFSTICMDFFSIDFFSFDINLFNCVNFVIVFCMFILIKFCNSTTKGERTRIDFKLIRKFGFKLGLDFSFHFSCRIYESFIMKTYAFTCCHIGTF